VGERWRTLRELPAAQGFEYLTHRLAGVADRVRMRLGRMPHQPATYAFPMPPTLLRVRETLRLAMATYRPRPYHAGPIVYVRALISQNGYGDPMPLWRRVARGGLVIAEVPGSHNDMIVEPDLQIVAAALDRELKAG